MKGKKIMHGSWALHGTQLALMVHLALILSLVHAPLGQSLIHIKYIYGPILWSATAAETSVPVAVRA